MVTSSKKVPASGWVIGKVSRSSRCTDAPAALSVSASEGSLGSSWRSPRSSSSSRAKGPVASTRSGQNTTESRPPGRRVASQSRSADAGSGSCCRPNTETTAAARPGHCRRRLVASPSTTSAAGTAAIRSRATDSMPGERSIPMIGRSGWSRASGGSSGNDPQHGTRIGPGDRDVGSPATAAAVQGANRGTKYRSYAAAALSQAARRTLCRSRSSVMGWPEVGGAPTRSIITAHFRPRPTTAKCHDERHDDDATAHGARA